MHDEIIETSQRLSRASRKHLTSGLRSFLRFAHAQGYLERSLIDAVPVITIGDFLNLKTLRRSSRATQSALAGNRYRQGLHALRGFGLLQILSAGTE